MGKKNMKKILAGLLVIVMVLTGFPGTGSLTVHTRAESLPGKVTSLTLSVNSRPAAKLSWDQATGGADSYKIYRNNKAIAEVKPDPDKARVSYLDESLVAGESYTYTVKACRISADGYSYGPASAPEKIVEGYTYEKKGSNATLTGSTRKDQNLTLPAKIDGVPVIEIGPSCFANNIDVHQIKIPDGVRGIDDFAFECCSRLQKVYFPYSLKTIGEGAFSGCGNLRLADMQEGITSIGRGAFLCCENLQVLELPTSVHEIGRFAFAFCSELDEVNLKKVQITELPDRIFCYCGQLRRVILPDSLQRIKKRAFFQCSSLSQIEGSFKSAVEIEDYAFQDCLSLTTLNTEFFAGNVFTFGFSVFADAFSKATVLPMKEGTVVRPGTFNRSHFYGLSLVNPNGMPSQSNKDYQLKNGSLYSKDGSTLMAYFSRTDTSNGYAMTEEAGRKEYTVADGCSKIWPYAFSGSDVRKVILPDTVTSIEDYTFTNSYIKGPESLFDRQGNPVNNVSISDKAFENPAQEPENLPIDNDTWMDDDDDSTEDDSDFENIKYTFESASGDKSIFNPDKYSGYMDIAKDFEIWSQKYIEYNGNIFDGGMSDLTYTLKYKGNDYYRMMTAVLNHDAYKVKQSIEIAGDDFEEIFLMMDHGLFVELSRGRMPDDLVLYSGITPERKALLAGVDRSRTNVSVQELVDKIGQEYSDEAVMSTTADPFIAYKFSSGDYGSNTIVVIYASKEAMDDLGTIDADAMDGTPFYSEEEILFNANARYRILDVGQVTSHMPVGEQDVTDSRTYIRLELLGEAKDPSRKMDGTEILSEPKYDWAKDNKSVTAAVTINEDSGEKVTETTRDISFEVIKEPNSEEAGSGKYTAHFKKDYFSDQVKMVELPAKSDDIRPGDSASNIDVVISKIKDKTYSGEAILPGVTVKVGGKQLELDKDYTLSYKNNIKVGIATVIIKGIGSYTGTSKRNFRILPKGTKIVKMKAKKKTIVLAWKRNLKETTGYQIQYGLKKNFKGAKTKKVKNKVTKIALNGLKSKKKYYIRIRTFKRLGKKRFFSPWSKVKKAKAK